MPLASIFLMILRGEKSSISKKLTPALSYRESDKTDGLRFKRKREQVLDLQISWHLFLFSKFIEIREYSICLFW
jgi:hypothetical protein